MKKLSTKPEAAKAAPATLDAAAAAAGANQSGAGTEGVGLGAVSGSGASSEAGSSTTGPATPASVLGGAGEDTIHAGGGPSWLAQDADDQLALLIVEGEPAVPRSVIVSQTLQASGLDQEQWDGLSDATRTRLVDMAVEGLKLGYAIVRGIRDAAKAALDEGDLVKLEVRSRDGKPFRRAGFVFCDAYQTVHATSAQVEQIRGDRGCQVKA